MISVIIIWLIATNIITIYLLNRKEIKKYFAKSFIKSVNLEKVNKIFESEKISENLYGPKKEVIVKSFCVPSGDKDIVGKTSDYEAWILSSLSKISKNIFEFGTCSGKTTTLMALNSPNDWSILSHGSDLFTLKSTHHVYRLLISSSADWYVGSFLFCDFNQSIPFSPSSLLLYVVSVVIL